MRDRPTFSCIVPVRDHTALLRRLLTALFEQCPAGIPFEVVVVDDGSAIPIAPDLAGFDVRVVRLEESQGPAHARNVGASEAAAPYLFFLDADVIYPAEAMEKALAIFESRPEVGGVSFVNQTYDPEANAVQNFVAVTERYWWKQLFDSGDDVVPVGGLTSRSGAVRRTVFEEIGGFDTSFRTNAHEDYDFGKRLAAASICVMLREPIFYHSFPLRLSRVVRNYWVRISLWVPYYIERRPALDKTQTSPGEMRLRVLAVLPQLIALYAVIAPGFRSMPMGVALVLFGVYLYALAPLLRCAWEWSEQNEWFVVKCIGYHMATSTAIVAGGLWGVAAYALESRRSGEGDSAGSDSRDA